MPNLNNLFANKKRWILGGVVLGLVALNLLALNGNRQSFGPNETKPTPAEVAEAAGLSVNPETLGHPLGGAVPTQTANTFQSAVGAFDCGSGNFIGAIEPGRGYVQAEWPGDEHALRPLGLTPVEVDGSGLVCVEEGALK